MGKSGSFLKFFVTASECRQKTGDLLFSLDSFSANRAEASEFVVQEDCWLSSKAEK